MYQGSEDRQSLQMNIAAGDLAAVMPLTLLFRPHRWHRRWLYFMGWVAAAPTRAAVTRSRAIATPLPLPLAERDGAEPDRQGSRSQ